MDAHVLTLSQYGSSTSYIQSSRAFANTQRPKCAFVRGPVLITIQYDASKEGLYIAAIILLNVGVIPLIATNLGFARTMYVFAHDDEKWQTY